MITNVTNAGHTVISIISDNNVVNRKMFMSLSGSDHLLPYIINPVNNIDNIFFDSVHILKCIRNNWINLKKIGEHLHSLDLIIIMKYFLHHLQN